MPAAQEAPTTLGCSPWLALPSIALPRACVPRTQAVHGALHNVQHLPRLAEQQRAVALLVPQRQQRREHLQLAGAPRVAVVFDVLAAPQRRCGPLGVARQASTRNERGRLAGGGARTLSASMPPRRVSRSGWLQILRSTSMPASACFRPARICTAAARASAASARDQMRSRCAGRSPQPLRPAPCSRRPSGCSSRTPPAGPG